MTKHEQQSQPRSTLRERAREHGHAGVDCSATTWCSFRPPKPPRLSVKFAWYDMWVGAFYDQAKHVLYVCPLPCVLITYRFPEAEWYDAAGGAS